MMYVWMAVADAQYIITCINEIRNTNLLTAEFVYLLIFSVVMTDHEASCLPLTK